MSACSMKLAWCVLAGAALLHLASSDTGHVITWNHTPGDAVVLTLSRQLDTDHFEQSPGFNRRKRDVIEEEKYYYPEKPRENNDADQKSTPWIPETIPADTEDKNFQVTQISTTSENMEQALPLYHITEKPTEKPGRGARMASHDQWIKLPSPSRDEEEKDRVLTPPQPSNDLLNSRMPRVNFVTQNKRLETSESRNERDSVPRSTVSRNDDLRVDFAHPGVDSRARSMKEVYPREAVYYPEEERRRYLYEDRYYPVDDPYRRDPYSDPYDRRLPDYVPYRPGPRIDRLDPSVYDSYLTRKPKRIIYYAHLPEVVRSPPSVDMRYKYSGDPYRRFEDDYLRSGRYDPRFKPRYPYNALRKDDRASRDLVGSSTKDKRTDSKDLVPPTVSPKKEEFNPRDKNTYNNINSHQYHLDSSELHYTEPLHKLYPDVVRSDQAFLRYDVPSFQAPIDDPYADRH